MPSNNNNNNNNNNPHLQCHPMATAMKGKHYLASADADFLRNARMRARVRVAFEPLVRICMVLRL